MKEAFSTVTFFLTLVFSALGQFTDITDRTGVMHVCQSGELLGAGGAFVDINGDDYIDMVLAGGAQADKIYINQKDNTFVEETWRFQYDQTDKGVTSGVSIGDVNNDGCKDIFLTTITSSHSNVLLVSNCDGTFLDLSSTSGINDANNSVHSAFVDVNGDGFLDIYVINYIREDRFESDSTGMATGFDHSCDANVLYINDGTGKFDDMTETYGASGNGCALAVAAYKLGQGSDSLSIMIANDFGAWLQPNETLLVEETQAFTDVAQSYGLDAQMFGMGIAFTDVNADNRLDVFVSNLGENKFFVSNEQGKYADRIKEYGLGQSEDIPNHTSWGCDFEDFNGDGYDDLIVARGHIPSAEFLNVNLQDTSILYMFDPTTQSYVRSVESQFHNRGRNRGLFTGDIDNDGDLDVCIASVSINTADEVSPNGLFRIYENNFDQGKSFLNIDLINQFNRVENFVQVFVHTDIGVFEKNKSVDGSFCSYSDDRVFIGLGDARVIDSVTIIWDNNSSSNFADVELNSFIRITQGVNDIQDQMDLSVSTNELSIEDDLFISPTIIGAGSTLVEVTSSLEFDQSSQVIVYDMNGRIFLPEYNVSSEIIRLDVQGLPTGVYVLSVRDKLQYRNTKLVVASF